MAESRVKNIVTGMIEAEISETMAREAVAYDDIITFRTDSSGRITAFTSNSAEMNRLRTELLSAVIAQVATLDTGKLCLRDRKAEVNHLDIQNALERLCSQCAPSGFERPAAEVAAELLRPFVDEVSIDRMGNVVGVRRCGRKDAPRLLLDAHLDEVGFIVTHIDEDLSLIHI